jgi:hypothetical protein
MTYFAHNHIPYTHFAMSIRARLAQLLFLVLLQQMMRFMRETAAFQACQWPPPSLSFRTCGSAAPMPFEKERRTRFSSKAWSRSRTSVRMSHSDQPLSLSTTAPISSHSILPLLDNHPTSTTLGSELSLSNDTAACKSTTTTRYTIDSCPRTDPVRLQRIVDKHVTTLDRYLAHKPIAQHTLAAYQELCRQLHKWSQQQSSPNATTALGQYSIVLDSGCGTGRSSLVLGRLYPQHIVVGVDRSVARLSKQKTVVAPNRVMDDCNSLDAGLGGGDNDPGEGGGGVLVQQVAGNVWLVRAELTDFWRLLLWQPQAALQSGGGDDDSDDANKDAAMTTTTMTLSVVHHYLLYPNPYPKQVRLNQRWYAHASFPILLQLLQLHCSGSGNGGGSLTVRSNWRQYLEEFGMACQFYQSSLRKMGHGNGTTADTTMSWTTLGPVEMGPSVVADMPPTAAWTNFEEKYWLVGERTYELVVTPSTMPL